MQLSRCGNFWLPCRHKSPRWNGCWHWSSNSFWPITTSSYTDKMSMAVGVEVRVPFLDPDLVDFAAHIPTRYKQRDHVGKWVLKKAMELFSPRCPIVPRPDSARR